MDYNKITNIDDLNNLAELSNDAIEEIISINSDHNWKKNDFQNLSFKTDTGYKVIVQKNLGEEYIRFLLYDTFGDSETHVDSTDYCYSYEELVDCFRDLIEQV